MRSWAVTIKNETDDSFAVDGLGASRLRVDARATLKVDGGVPEGHAVCSVYAADGTSFRKRSIKVDRALTIHHFGLGEGRWVVAPTDGRTRKAIVIVLPGIPGSILKKNGQRIWPPDRFSNLLSVLDNLRLDPMGNDADGTVEASGIIKSIPGLGDLYQGLFTALTDAGYREYSSANSIPANSDVMPVIGFAFDWRKDLRKAADDLYRAVQLARKRTGLEHVVLIGHSMGSVVAVAAMALYPQIKVDRTILLGPPLNGAPAAFVVSRLRSLSTAHGIEAMLMNFGLALSMGVGGAFMDSLYHVLSNFPAMYQLLPSEWADEILRRKTPPRRGFIAIHDIPVGNVAAYSLLRGPGLRSELADAGLEFHRDIRRGVDGMFGDTAGARSATKRVFLFAGRQPTYDQVHVKLGRFNVRAIVNTDLYVVPDGALRQSLPPRMVLKRFGASGPLFEFRPAEGRYFYLLLPGEPRFAMQRTAASRGRSDVTAVPWDSNAGSKRSHDQQWSITPEGYLESRVGGVLSVGNAESHDIRRLVVRQALPFVPEHQFWFDSDIPSWDVVNGFGDGTVPDWSSRDFYGHWDLDETGREKLFGVGEVTCDADHRGMAADASVIKQICALLLEGATVPDVPRLSLPDGLLISQKADPKVYVMCGMANFWIPDGQTFTAMGLSWSDVHIVEAGLLDGLPTVPFDGSVFCEAGTPTVWMSAAGAKLPCDDERERQAITTATPTRLPPNAARDIPDIPRDGTLLRATTFITQPPVLNTFVLYRMSQGRRRQITDKSQPDPERRINLLAAAQWVPYKALLALPAGADEEPTA